MPAPKRVGLFFLQLVLVYGLLAAPWPGLERGWAALYRTAANTVFGSFGSAGRVVFRAPPPGGRMDTELVVGRRGSSVTGTGPHSARLTGYMPLIAMVALILATPLPFRRRLRALGWGLGLTVVFVGLRIWLMLLHWYTGDAPWCLWQPPSWLERLLTALFEGLVVSPTPSFVVPVFVWLAATFRRGDLERLRALVAQPRDAANATDPLQRG